jgi:hypothetical protein
MTERSVSGNRKGPLSPGQSHSGRSTAADAALSAMQGLVLLK